MQAEPEITFRLTWITLILLIAIPSFAVWAWRSQRRRPLFIVTATFLIVAAVFFYGLFGIRSHRAVQVREVRQAVANVVLTSPAEVASVPLEISQAADLAPAPPQPAWVSQSPRTINGEYVFTVTAGPHASDELCEKDLTVVLRQRVDEFIDNFIGEPGAARRVQLDMAYIREHLLKEQSFETIQASFGPMKNLHARVVIDRAAQDLIRRLYHDALVNARLGYTAGAFGLLMVLLGTAFSYLKLDTATKGYYSGRLKLAATAVILTAAAATALVVRQADPAAEWPVGFPVRESPQVVKF